MYALKDPEVMNTLRLTLEQRQKLKSVFEEAHKQMLHRQLGLAPGASIAFRIASSPADKELEQAVKGHVTDMAYELGLKVATQRMRHPRPARQVLPANARHVGDLSQFQSVRSS